MADENPYDVYVQSDVKSIFQSTENVNFEQLHQFSNLLVVLYAGKGIDRRIKLSTLEQIADILGEFPNLPRVRFCRMCSRIIYRF